MSALDAKVLGWLREAEALLAADHDSPAKPLTIQRDGWGAVDITPKGVYTIETLEIRPGSWFVFVPIRMRWRGVKNYGRIDFYFALAEGFPSPEVMEVSDHIAIQPLMAGEVEVSGDICYTLALGVVNTQYTEVDILCRTYADGQGQVQDGDTIRIGLVAG